MELMTALTKTEQVTNFLREEIGNNKLQPGTKIQSSRNLASNFATSKQVVESAFNILEDEGLIIRKARQGAFVNKASALSHLIEVYILGVGVTENDPYFREIMKLTYPPILKDNFSFVTRTYSPSSIIDSILDIEINRINNMPGLDCVLINAAPLTRTDVKKCLKIRKPLIFLGDFSTEEISDIKFNRITGDNACLAEQQIEYMCENGHKEITLFSGSLEHLFNRQFYDGALNKAKEKKVKINIVEFPKGITSSMTEKERNEIIEKTLKQAILDKLIFPDMIVAGLERRSIKQGLRALDISLYQAFSLMPESQIDYMPFHNEIITRIEELIIFPDKYEKTRLKLLIEFKGGTMQ
jgi:DNA-binding LacI/PurR family transcriptional regulator